MRSSQLYNYVLSWLIEQRQRTMLARVPNKITTSRTEADRLEIEVRENMKEYVAGRRSIHLFTLSQMDVK